MAKEKKEYIEKNLVMLLHYWVSFVTGLGAFVIMYLALLDYLVTPENFKIFLIYRVVAAFIIFLIFLLNRKIINEKLHHLYTITAAITVTTMVSLMIAKFGGHQSPYFAGIILGIIYIVGFTPLNVKMSIIASVIMYSIYLVPILIYDQITNMRLFYNANIFIFSVIVSLVAMRYLMHKRFVNELSLQYDLEEKKKDLEEKKKELEIYSAQLEDMVAERTRELKKTEIMLTSLFEHANDGIIITDRTGRVINVNQKACEMFGFEKDAIINAGIELIEARDDRRTQRERQMRIINGESVMYETERYRKDGSRIFLEISARAVEVEGKLYIQEFNRDITEKKQLQLQLFHSQKMESIGTLAGGIAHNFNNVLTGILGNVELIRLEDKPRLDKSLTEKINTIENAGRMAAEMIAKLLGFARKNVHEILPFNLNSSVRDTLGLVGRSIDKRINIQLELDENLPLVEGDPNQIEQVVMNLVVNARDAMPSGGFLTLRTSVTEVEKGVYDMPIYVQEGKYVLLEVKDTGTGIPEKVLNKIFEPFFTTKEKGKGTGLGLSMVYGTVKDHKGYVTVTSRVDEGTAFKVYLPISEKTLHEMRKEESPAPKTHAHETIFIIDDDEFALGFIRDALEHYGYKATTVNNPMGALERFHKVSNEVMLVITDMSMPLMDGEKVIDEIRKIKPDIKIIAASGKGDIDCHKVKADGILQKPFRSEELVAMIKKIVGTDRKSKNV